MIKPTISNAFTRSGYGRPRLSRPARSGKLSLAPLKATLAEAPAVAGGWTLQLRPMGAVDTLQTWRDISPLEASANMVWDVQQHIWRDARQRLPLSIAEIADRLAIEPVERLGDGGLVVDDAALADLFSLLETSHLRAARVLGPIEHGDAAAMAGAVLAGASPLTAELRAEAAMRILRDREITLEVREKAVALAFVAENMRHYMAALLQKPAHDLGLPAPWQIEGLLSLTGSLLVRPVETEVYGTSIDVGISTQPGTSARPANRSLIYDLPSHTWHDEP